MAKSRGPGKGVSKSTSGRKTGMSRAIRSVRQQGNKATPRRGGGRKR